ncbi:MAG: hypothetical protein JSS76_11425 [Bacteroidetes bacterium]|nr:hypothetical protein [Bacteroidota bacterium]
MKFKDEFFIALNQWQKGWAEKQENKDIFSISLKAECNSIDEKYKIVTEPCYRKRFLHREELIDIIINDSKTEGITSWTTDVRFAELFKGKYRENAVTAAVFEHLPKREEVIVNINKLWKCKDFTRDLESFRKRNPEDTDAIFNFRDTQKEIVLEAPLKGSEICILSGKSSSFDDICNSINVPEIERPQLFKRLISDGAFIEEITYVKNEAARKAIQNTIRKFYDLLAGLKK